MKSLSFKNAAMILFSFIAVTLTSCWGEETVETPFKEQLAGTWDIDSYKLNGDEYMGLLIESGSITFHAYTGTVGRFEQDVVFPDGESFSIGGAYTADEEREEVSMQYEDETIVAQVDINGDKMIWSGVQDGWPLVIKATKR